MDVCFPDDPVLERSIEEAFDLVTETLKAMSPEEYRKIPTVLLLGCFVSEEDVRDLFERSVESYERAQDHQTRLLGGPPLPPVEEWTVSQIEEQCDHFLMQYDVESCSFRRVDGKWAFVWIDEFKSAYAEPIERYMRAKLEVMGVAPSDFRDLGERIRPLLFS